MLDSIRYSIFGYAYGGAPDCQLELFSALPEGELTSQVTKRRVISCRRRCLRCCEENKKPTQKGRCAEAGHSKASLREGGGAEGGGRSRRRYRERCLLVLQCESRVFAHGEDTYACRLQASLTRSARGMRTSSTCDASACSGSGTSAL